MKSKPISFAGTLLLILAYTFSFAQFGIKSSALWLSDCNQNNYFNTNGSGADLIGPLANVFQNANLGSHTQNSSTLLLRGGQVRTFKNPASSNVCNVSMHYRVYPQSGVPGAFTTIDLGTPEDCGAGTYSSGDACSPGDQQWNRVIADGTTIPYSPINLTSYAPGNYVLEVYYEAAGSQSATTGCAETVLDNNTGNYYRATFSIDAPTISSTNPSSCSGNQGSITLGGLTPGATYNVSYNDDGNDIGPDPYTANGSGQIIITGLNKGFYSNFSLTINGCTTSLFTGVILSDPIYVPTFSAIAPFCAGTTAPSLPTTSNNGFAGTWSPATISNTSSGTYTFTPSAGQCAMPISINVTVIPPVTPSFSFGTSLNICAGGSVPSLPNTSQNGITGTWSPATVSNTASGTYTFTPNAGQCATSTTFTVDITPNVTPTFSFGTNTTICSGGTVVTLPTTSQNGVTGTWSPASVSNTSSGTYTFTPDAGQCALPTTYTVNVNPNITPTFSFGTSLTICSGGSVPALPTTSQNGINGTWSPATVSATIPGTYTFTPTGGQCAVPTTFVVTVSPNITPTFDFGTNLSICEGEAVPALPTTSQNGITGTWSPATVSNTGSTTYTFTPTAGQCALPTTFIVTVNPNITPTFSFGTSLAICSGGTVPQLPTTSQNGITGTWSPATVSNTSSATYTFTPAAGQCVTGGTTFTVTVTPNIIPVFSFGSSLTICSGGTVPTLPGTSQNGISGTWSPATVSNTVSGTYTFTPAPGQCVTPFTYTVTVNPIVTPTFSFGTTQSVCIGAPAPALVTTSQNGITGTWSPAIIDNQNSATYTFTPDPGQCAIGTTLTYEVNPIPSVNVRTDTTVYDGAVIPGFNFTNTPGSIVTWTNSNPSIGLAATGTGPIPSFTAVNLTNAPVTATITLTPRINGCAGTARTYIITVLPLDKDVFVPNVFSPNGDGKNDVLYVYGNYINKVDMRIFNQWGQQVASITSKTQGWDGRHKGSPQPVGVYMYACQVTLTDGRNLTLKGSITLVR